MDVLFLVPHKIAGNRIDGISGRRWEVLRWMAYTDTIIFLISKKGCYLI